MSVFDQIGGTPATKVAVAVLYDRITADAALAPWFETVDLRRLKSHQLQFLSSALGGPDEFAGRSLREAHAGMQITDAAFDVMVTHLRAALEQIGVVAAAVTEIVTRVDAMREQIVEPSAS